MATERKKICAVTMVRNDDFYLRRWVEYYGRELGKENLYIFFDGTDQEIADFCEGTNVTAVEKIPGQVVAAEKGRLDLLSETAAGLLKKYDLVIGTDADEFLVVDPNLGLSLADYLSGQKIDVCLSGLGIDMGQFLGKKGDPRAPEGDIDDSMTFLSQRHYGLLGTRYTKPSVIATPVRWGRGFHRVKGHNFHIGRDLFLFHFGYFDMARIQARFADKDRAAAGWTRHLAKRSRTIRVVTEKPARDFDKWTAVARRVQTFVRPPYAWNKPAMFNLDIVVRIPDRFGKII